MVRGGGKSKLGTKNKENLLRDGEGYRKVLGCAGEQKKASVCNHGCPFARQGQMLWGWTHWERFGPGGRNPEKGA